ncbi:MAG TPA: type II toxin-antitoxin system HicA family toxin [Candidatus Elarobacter sp.]|jgi:predicted RNA binding protein YcfA (HicA-like mRNA interferase family)|nr:type II toxin-antitoxin system HicA family toxin [Candidatus Elarobacter sp.]
MSSKLPAVTGPALVRAFTRAGFRKDRQSGSHLIMEHPDGRFASIPMHGKQAIPIGTLRGILASARVDIKELRRFL